MGVFRGILLDTDWKTYTATDWAAVLPAAGTDDALRLSRAIMQRLNGK